LPGLSAKAGDGSAGTPRRVLQTAQSFIYYAIGFLFLAVVSLSITAICHGLYWWAFYCPVATVHTTVFLFWLKNFFAFFTLVKVLAGICLHIFFFLMTTFGASYS